MKTKEILILGGNGQLGRALTEILPIDSVIAVVGREDINLFDFDQIRKKVRQYAPKIILNAAAYTLVDEAEREEELAMRINGKAVGVLAEEADRLGAVLVHYSTDFVFDGEKGMAYTEEDPVNPINVYGRSKLAGEEALVGVGGRAIVLRTSWLYDMEGNNFVTKTLGWARQYARMKIVADQFGSPTWVKMLAEMTASLVLREDVVDLVETHKGIYHLGGAGAVSRYEWVREILKLDPYKEEHKVERIEEALTADFPTPAARPKYSVLDNGKFEKTFGMTVPNWQVNLREALSR